MPKLLKDNQNHLAAFKYARQFDQGAGFFDLMAYTMKLAELEPEAVAFYCWPETADEGVYYVFHFPTAAYDFEDDELPADVELELIALNLDQAAIYNKPDAAAWCGVSLRCLEQWMKGSSNKGREPLRFFKHGRDRYFLERDLWDFMTSYGVGTTWKFYRSFLEASLYHKPASGDNIPGNKNQKRKEK